MPERTSHGWWGAVPAGAEPDETVNWSNRYEALVLPPGTYDVLWVQHFGMRDRPIVFAEAIEIEAGQVLGLSVDSGVRLEAADWMPKRSRSGWWGAAPAGAGPNERVNWTDSDDMLLLPPGRYDVVWVQRPGSGERPIVLANGIKVEAEELVMIVLDDGVDPDAADLVWWP